MIRAYSKKKSKLKKETPTEDEGSSVLTTGTGKNKCYQDVRRLIDIRQKQYYEDKVEKMRLQIIG